MEIRAPGEGISHFAKQSRQFKRLGYDGYWTPEVSAAVQRRPDFDPDDAMRKAYNHLTGCPRKAKAARRWSVHHE